MARLREVSPYLLLLFNLISILAISWFVSWTYLYSFSQLWRYLSATDFRNVLCISMTISTLIVIDGAVVLGKTGILRVSQQYPEAEKKRLSTTRK
jgi:hypothetical protein